MSMSEFARFELEKAGWFDDDQAMAVSLLAAIGAFAAYSHSGSSGPAAAAVLLRLIHQKPLSPLTGDEDEWVHVTDDPKPLWQNKRCGSVFTDGTGAYDIDAQVTRYPDGTLVSQDEDRRTVIAFPYDVPEQPRIVDRPFPSDHEKFEG